MASRKIYSRIGLRRDKNLSDLSNRTVALNNILDNLSGGGGLTFVKDDLKAITGVFAEGMRHSGYIKMGGSGVEATDSSGNTSAQLPRLSFQNRVDQFELSSGNPRLSGGDGPTARYFDKDQVFEYHVNNEGVRTGIFSGAPFATDNFWEHGQFDWDRKLHPSAANVNGGIEWEGYYIPTTTGQHTFHPGSSGCFTFEFQDESWTGNFTNNTGVAGTYTTYAHVGITSTLPVEAVSSGNVLTLKNSSDMIYVGIGQTVKGTNINSTDSDPRIISDYSVSGRTVTLEPPASGDSITGSIGDGALITFSKGVNQTVKANSRIKYTLQEFRPYRIRVRYFIPQSHDGTQATKSFNLDVSPAGGPSQWVRYTSLYSRNYDFSDEKKGTFNKYFDNSIRFGGGTVGGTAKPNYVKIKTSKKIDVKYSPLNKTKSSVERATLTLSTSNNSNVIGCSNTSNIEIGNYIYDNSNRTGTVVIPEGTRILDVIINDSLVISNNANASGSNEFKIVDHRGHVQRIVANGNSGNSRLDVHGNYSNLGKIRKDMLVVGDSLSQNNTKVVTASSGQIVITPGTSNTSNQAYYIYQYQGLINDSLETFCVPSGDPQQNKCVSVTQEIPVGSTTIHIDDTADIDDFDRVLGFYFAAGTRITSGGVNPGAGTITIDTGTTKLIKDGNNFTVSSIPATSTDDKSLCCPPKDTSPPFAATEVGMETTSGFRILEINSGNIKFDALRAEVATSNTWTASSTADYTTLLGTSTDKRIEISTGSGTYKLITTA